jgi:hypothetical protein
MSYETLGRLPDPTTNPAGPGFVSQQILDNTPGMMHNLNHGGSVSVKFSGSYWTIDIGYPQLTISQANTIIPFIYSLQGGFTNFYVQLPTMANPQTGAWVSNGIVAGNVSMGTNSNQLSIANWSTRGTGNELNPGDMLKLTNHNKIYMITNTSLTADIMTLTLNCDVLDPTQVAVASIQPNDIKFRVRQKGAAPGFSLTPEGLYNAFSLSLRENFL